MKWIFPRGMDRVEPCAPVPLVAGNPPLASHLNVKRNVLSLSRQTIKVGKSDCEVQATVGRFTSTRGLSESVDLASSSLFLTALSLLKLAVTPLRKRPRLLMENPPCWLDTGGGHRTPSRLLIGQPLPFAPGSRGAAVRRWRPNWLKQWWVDEIFKNSESKRNLASQTRC